MSMIISAGPEIQMKVNLNQHMYTSAKDGFSTVACSGEITGEMLALLERNSMYMLPRSILYDENKKKPDKYVYYRLGENHFVTGRAVYSGLDNIGRPGNYFFHNFIISRDEFIYLQMNPVRIINALVQSRLFKSDFSDKTPPVLQLSVENSDSFKLKNRNKDALTVLLNACYHLDEITEPVFFKGNSDIILKYLEIVFDSIPYRVRENLSFDTMSYGINLFTRIVSLPGEKDYENFTFPHSVEMDTDSHMCSVKSEIPRADIVNHITEKIEAGKIEEIRLFNNLDRLINLSRYDEFNSIMPTLSHPLKKNIYDVHKSEILNWIVSEKRVDSFILIKEFIELNDMVLLFPIIEEIIDTGDESLNSLIVKYTSQNWDKPDCSNLLIKNIELLPDAIDIINSLAFYLKMLELLQGYYDQKVEEFLLKQFIISGIWIKEGKKIYGNSLVQVIRGLPQTESENLKILRNSVLYIVSGEDDYLKKLVNFDISIIKGETGKIITGIIFTGIIKKTNSDKIPSYIKSLFTSIADKVYFIGQLIFFLENDKASRGRREVVNKAIMPMISTAKTALTDDARRKLEDLLYVEPLIDKLKRVGGFFKRK